jgi:predicted Zn-dependent protease
MVDRQGEATANAAAGRSSLTRFANSFIHQNVSEDRTSVSLTVVVDGRLASGSTTVVDDGGLQRLVESTIAAAKLRPVDPDWPGLAPPAPIPDVDHYDAATAAASPSERANVVRAFVAAGDGLTAAGYCATDDRDFAFANTAGQRATGRSTVATFEGIHQLVPGVAAGLASSAGTRLADIDGAALGADAAATARAAADPVDIEPGDYEVVLHPEAMATLLLFLCYDGFNAKSYLQGESCIELGQTQFDALVNIVDDALDPRGLGIGYDIEGTPKRRLELVRDGVSSALAHDRRTASKAGADSTGHAVPGGEIWGPFPTDAFMAGGDKSVDDLVAEMDRGLLVSELNYCRVLDPKTMVMTGLTRNGTFLVENGKVVQPVKNLRFTQSFRDALGPGNVLGLGTARHAASNEDETIHAPSAHLARWHFTGGAKG